LRPQTAAAAVKPYLVLCDEVLFMTVNPGYGGQSFMSEVLPEIAELRKYVNHNNAIDDLDIMVDGGINFETGEKCAAAGANLFVTGSFMFKQDDMGSAVTYMRDRCAVAGSKFPIPHHQAK